jgi:hypothetical protein
MEKHPRHAPLWVGDAAVRREPTLDGVAADSAASCLICVRSALAISAGLGDGIAYEPSSPAARRGSAHPNGWADAARGSACASGRGCLFVCLFVLPSGGAYLLPPGAVVAQRRVEHLLRTAAAGLVVRRPFVGKLDQDLARRLS